MKLMTYAKLKLAMGITAGILLAGGAATVALSGGSTNTSPQPGKVLSSGKTSVLITTKFAIVSDGSLKKIGLNGPGVGAGDKSGVVLLTAQQFNAINGTLAQSEEVEVLGAPQAATADGMQARISVTESVKLDGTNANVGVSLDVTPHVSMNPASIDLDLIAELSELVDSSANQDGSKRDIRMTTATLKTRLLPGQTAVIRQKIEGAGKMLKKEVNGPKSLVVFVTPRLFHERLQQTIRRAEPK